MNLDVVGLILLDNSKPERTKMFNACVRSLDFLRGEIRLLIHNGKVDDYGAKYRELLDQCESDYIANWFEDHFAVLDDKETMNNLILTMQESGADVMKTSFFEIEWNSVSDIEPVFENEYGFVYENTPENHAKYQKFYGSRYYCGCNFITTKDFAKRYWSRTVSGRPHEYEIVRYEKSFEHRVMIPKVEVFASIDDSHGAKRSNLLARNEPKFWNLYQ